MDKTRVIRLDEPLPCGITGGGDVPCGRPALAAYADPDPLRPGQWVLTPVCERHAAAMAAMYAQGGAVGKRYVAQLRAPDGDRWEDCAYFDNPERAGRFAETAAETNPNVGAGRVFDQVTGQVVEDPDR